MSKSTSQITRGRQPGKAGTAQASQAAARRGRPARGDRLVGQAQQLAADWGPTAARILLGLVLAWFGYHELAAPRLWTGYVPGVSATSTFAILLVLAHGWVLLMLAVAIIAGVALRLAAAVAALLLLQIVITLKITGGLTDLTLRDMGVLGLAVCLTGNAKQRAALTR